MSKVHAKQTRWSGASAVASYWKCYALAGGLLIGGWMNLAEDSPVEAGGLAALAPWAVAVGAGLLAWTAIQLVFGGRFWVTHDRVVHSRGVVSRETSQIPIARLREVRVQQGPIERLFNIGSVRASVEGEPDDRVILSGVPNPRELAALIDDAAGEEAEKEED